MVSGVEKLLVIYVGGIPVAIFVGGKLLVIYVVEILVAISVVETPVAIFGVVCLAPPCFLFSLSWDSGLISMDALIS